MVTSRGRGRSGRGTRGILQTGKGGRGRLICSYCGKEGHLQNRCYDYWPEKIANISSSDIPSNGRTGSQLISDEEYQEFLRLKSSNHTQSSTPPITFYADSFIIQDQNTGQLIGKGHELRGLYYLSNNPSTLCFASVSPKLLHNRLGHPSLAKIKLM
ncbi:hypothetical protein CR513_10448, partial [Mucuna pruriens]